MFYFKTVSKIKTKITKKFFFGVRPPILGKGSTTLAICEKGVTHFLISVHCKFNLHCFLSNTKHKNALYRLNVLARKQQRTNAEQCNQLVIWKAESIKRLKFLP
jgi:hypothetical protein